MSRSYKKQPFMAITGRGSAKQDKILAHRGERQANKHAINLAMKNDDFENFLPLDRLECPWNEVYCWSRDGNQMYQELDHRDWQNYLESTSEDSYFGQWPPRWYVEMKRK
jgi:hypothetical protein